MPSGKSAKRQSKVPAPGLGADLQLVDAAKAKAGGNGRLAAIFGVDESAASRWGRQRRIPRHLRPRLEAYLEAPVVTGAESQASYGVRPPEYLDREWQATHAFTAMVEALMQLETISATSLSAWRTRVAWEAVLGASKVVREVAGWRDDADVPRGRGWEKIHRKGLDHWLRPKFGRRAEHETLRERLQIELGFTEEEGG